MSFQNVDFFSSFFIRLSISNENVSNKCIIFFDFYAYQSCFSQLVKYNEIVYLKIKIFMVLFVYKINDDEIGFFSLNPIMECKLKCSLANPGKNMIVNYNV